ncbi:AI-2E family transporter [Ulvibacterium sp.]|uniref:AI-2E family transporter n=1 Tax=Ulvibacterium sp. TaxID=2665914 RepID=UPI003CC57111
MKKLAYSAVGIGGVLTILILAKSILIPFVYGIILWFLGRYFKNLLHKIPFLKQRIPHWLLNTFIFAIIVFTVSFISRLITDNISSLLANSETYKTNLDAVLNQINSTLQIDLGQEISKSLEGFDYTTILGNIADALSGALGNLVMIVLYAAFLFAEEASLSKKIKKLFDIKEKNQKATTMLSRINDTFSDYIRLKTYLSLLTGFVGYVFLSIVGVDAAFFWAFLMFVLNYIPTIGSLIATLFPAFFSLIQFGELKPFIIILVGLGIVEWFIGNVMEPKLMGKSLNLSPLATILALVIWGQIWGITGMLLSTPITVVMLIIFSQFKNTRDVAILLSENGDIDEVYSS